MKQLISRGQLPPLEYSATVKGSVPLSLCQTRLPTPLYVAVRKQMQADGLSWRQVIRWAALQYLNSRNPELACKIWSQCV